MSADLLFASALPLFCSLACSATLTTNSRVQWLALLESVLLVSLTVFQIHYIRTWFSETSARGRV